VQPHAADAKRRLAGGDSMRPLDAPNKPQTSTTANRNHLLPLQQMWPNSTRLLLELLASASQKGGNNEQTSTLGCSSGIEWRSSG